jgi:hypothetical protein
MSNNTNQSAAHAQWVGDVKDQLQKLNQLLAGAPNGVDVKVTVGKAPAPSGDVVDFGEGPDVWTVSVSATKTETLI